MRVLGVPGSENSYTRRLWQAFRSLGIEVIESRYPSFRWPRNLLKFSLQLLKSPDLCHVHWYLSDSLYLTRKLFSRDLAKVWTVHNIVPHAPVFRDDLLVTRLYLDSVDIAVWHSSRSIEDARGRFAARGLPTTWRAENRVIPCMNYNGVWPDTVSDAEARERLGIEGSAFVVGHFAPIYPYKGTATFLDAIRRVRRKDVLFCIFGETKDPALESLMREAAASLPNLRLHLRYIPDEELQYWFKACNVVVQPFTNLTTSAAIYFPIAFKRPVIATPLGNIPDIVRHGETGWIARDAHEVAAAIEEAARKPEVARSMGENAYEWVARFADIATVAEKHVEAYERAIALR